MIEFSRRIPTAGGYLMIAAGPDSVTVALYGRRGGYRSGDSFAIGMAPVAGAALRAAEGVMLHNLDRDELDPTELSAVPELGTL